jgi:hypothetical protein
VLTHGAHFLTKRTNEQTNKRTNEQTNKRTNEQTNKRKETKMLSNNYTTPQVELVSMLLDHWPLRTGCSQLVLKLTDTEIISLTKAIEGYANFQADMALNVDKQFSKEGIF